MARWHHIVEMFENIEQYARQNKGTTFFWADSVGSCYRIVVGSSYNTSWEITPEDVLTSGGSGRGLDIAFAIQTSKGKEALLKNLNTIKDLHHPLARTAWERLIGDDILGGA